MDGFLVVTKVTKTFLYPDREVKMRKAEHYGFRNPSDVQYSVETLMRTSARKSVQRDPPRILSIKAAKYNPEAQRYEDLSAVEKGVSVAQFAQDFKNRYPDNEGLMFHVDLVIDRR